MHVPASCSTQAVPGLIWFFLLPRWHPLGELGILGWHVSTLYTTHTGMSLGNLWGVNHSTSLVVVLSSVTHGSVSHPPHLPSQSSHRPTPPPPPLWSSTLMPPPPPFFSSHPLLLIAFPHTPGRGTPSQNGCVLAHPPLRTSLLVAGHFPSLRMSAARVRPQQWKTVRSHPSLGQDPPDTPGRLRGNVAAVGGSWSMPAARLTTSYGISQDRSTAIGRSSPATTHGIRSCTNHPHHLPPPLPYVRCQLT
jgi:hypothetical protein